MDLQQLRVLNVTTRITQLMVEVQVKDVRAVTVTIREGLGPIKAIQPIQRATMMTSRDPISHAMRATTQTITRISNQEE